jgi:hypothetical protein
MILFAFFETASIQAVVALLVSIGSACVAVYTFWSTHLKKFFPLFFITGPSMRFLKTKQSFQIGDEETEVDAYQLFVGCEMTFFNSGAIPGMIEDLRIVFKSDDLTFAVFPLLVLDKKDYTSVGLHSAKGEMKFYGKGIVSHQWSGILLPKETTVTQCIIFHGSSSILSEIPRGKFAISIDFRQKGNKDWQTIQTLAFDGDDDVANHLLQSGDSLHLNQLAFARDELLVDKKGLSVVAKFEEEHFPDTPADDDTP